MQETKLNPSGKYISRASPLRSGGFRAQFAIPGLVPDYVRDQGKAVVYDTPDEAELAASRIVNKLANDRLALRNRFAEAEPMSAKELSQAIDDLDITPTELARLLQSEHVMAWLGGERRVPHMVRLLVGLMVDEKNEEQVRAITAQASSKGRTQ